MWGATIQLRLLSPLSNVVNLMVDEVNCTIEEFEQIMVDYDPDVLLGPPCPELCLYTLRMFQRPTMANKSLVFISGSCPVADVDFAALRSIQVIPTMRQVASAFSSLIGHHALKWEGVTLITDNRFAAAANILHTALLTEPERFPAGVFTVFYDKRRKVGQGERKGLFESVLTNGLKVVDRSSHRNKKFFSNMRRRSTAFVLLLESKDIVDMLKKWREEKDTEKRRSTEKKEGENQDQFALIASNLYAPDLEEYVEEKCRSIADQSCGCIWRKQLNGLLYISVTSTCFLTKDPRKKKKCKNNPDAYRWIDGQDQWTAYGKNLWEMEKYKYGLTTAMRILNHRDHAGNGHMVTYIDQDTRTVTVSFPKDKQIQGNSGNFGDDINIRDYQVDNFKLSLRNYRCCKKIGTREKTDGFVEVDVFIMSEPGGNGHDEVANEYTMGNFNPTQVHWPGNKCSDKDSVPPGDEEECKEIGTKVCKEEDEDASLWLILVPLATMSVVLALVPVWFVFRQRRMAAHAKVEDIWRLHKKDVRFVTDRVPPQPMLKMIQGMRDITKSTIPNISASQLPQVDKLAFPRFGVYVPGTLCWVGELDDETHLTNQLKRDLYDLRSVNHANVNPFIGAIIEETGKKLYAYTFQKWTLRDFLQKESAASQFSFKLSFAFDICKGLKYIHESFVGFHGDLKSTKVVVDSKWQCKVSDFGFYMYKDEFEDMGQEDDDSDRGGKYAKSKFWTAPEILKHTCTCLCNPLPRLSGRTRDQMHMLQQADTYSYGIILFEILSREQPYSWFSMTSTDVLANVLIQREPPFRPAFPSMLDEIDKAYKAFSALMVDCWQHEPESRPSVADILESLTVASDKYNESQLKVTLGAKYAQTLESVITVKKQQIEKERQEMEALLFACLPRSIAIRMIRNEEVQPEVFDSCSILFSDICGFTPLTSQSTPLQIVGVLNEMFTAYDVVLDRHDVYKVETIGDALSCVSGVPERNGIKHASEIASIALGLLAATNAVHVTHIKDYRLEIRVGAASGPCCAGIVGKKRPKYTIFGNTVGFSNEMEAAGEKMIAHITTEMKVMLDKVGGFYTAPRGMVAVGTLGELRTHNLFGMKGLPEAENLPVECLKLMETYKVK